MLDIKLIRKNPEIVKADLEKRGDKEKLQWVDDLVSKDKEYRELLMEVEKLRGQRNTVTKEIAEAMKAGDKQKAEEAKKIAAEIPDKIKYTEKNMEQIQEKVRFYLMRLPNILHESVPVGADEEGNVMVRTWGKPKKKEDFGFEPKSHVDMLPIIRGGNLEKAAEVSGARFYYLMNDLVLLDMAVQRMAIDLIAKKGFTPVYPPFMLKREPYEGVTDLGTFEEALYKIEGEDLYLISTSEHPLAALHMGEIIEEERLPLRYVGVSTCFRKEAGAHGKDTKGIYRVHQFNKIEQFIFCKPEDSWQLHEELIKNAEEIFQKLEIPYRIVNICTGDIGIVAAKKYDLEAWMPVQNSYREMISCSNCTSYQSNRLSIRYGRIGGGEKEQVHTLNSTAIATPRALVAIMENHQNEDGSVTIPKALVPYFGKDRIEARKR